MAAGQYDTIIEQGATFSRTITWKNTDGTGINLTGYTVSGKIKQKVSDKVALASFTVSVANQGTNPGQFTISLTAAETAKFPSVYTQDGKKQNLDLVYDIEASLAGSVTRILEGLLSCSPEVTK